MTTSKGVLGVFLGASCVFMVGAGTPALAQCELEKLTAADAVGCDRCGDAFGVSVSIDGDFIAVGAPGGLPGAPPIAIPGATYIFRRDGIAWIQEAKLIPADAQPDDRGGKVSISGERVLMGAASQNGFTGAAYIFRREGATWVQEAKLTAADADVGDTFGIGACLSGDVAVVGAWGDDQAGADAGAAYVFRRDDNGTPLDPSDDVWTQEAKLIPNDAVSGDLFGVDCSISGNRVVVGATQCNPGLRCGLPGKAYIFRHDGTNWVQEARLTASDGAPDDVFGGRVAIDGDSILVGAWFHDSACPSDPECNSGAVYFFRKPAGGWVDMTETAKFTATDTGAADNFGKSVAVRGDLAVVGVDLADEAGVNAGAAYIFRREGNLWIENAKLTANDPEVSDRLGFSVSLSGGLVVAGAFNDDDACPTDSGCNSGSAYVFAIGGDCNNNGTPDACDILDGISQDLNGNGIPDECEGQGACCLPDGSCADGLTTTECGTVGGAHRGDGTTCLGDTDANGIDDACEEQPIPTVSEWGLVVMVLLLLAGGKVYFGRRRSARTAA